MNYASQEKNRVAELKMKAAELTQIIEEGNLAHSSTKGSATMVGIRHHQTNDQGMGGLVGIEIKRANTKSKEIAMFVNVGGE